MALVQGEPMKIMTYSKWLALSLILSAGMNVQADNLSPISLKLGTVTEIDLGFDVLAANVSGIAIDREQIKKSVKGSDGIGMEVVKSDSGNYKLKVTVPTTAPSFASTQFELKAVDVKGDKKTLTIGTLAVEPVYEVIVHEDTTAKRDVWTSEKVTSFVTHKGGMKIRFISDDATVTHRIHSNGGAFEHQPDSLEPMKSNGDKDVYEVVVAEVLPKNQRKNTHYCHEHEGSANTQRNFVFNTDQ
jgi:hypothetical protein